MLLWGGVDGEGRRGRRWEEENGEVDMDKCGWVDRLGQVWMGRVIWTGLDDEVDMDRCGWVYRQEQVWMGRLICAGVNREIDKSRCIDSE